MVGEWDTGQQVAQVAGASVPGLCQPGEAALTTLAGGTGVSCDDGPLRERHVLLRRPRRAGGLSVAWLLHRVGWGSSSLRHRQRSQADTHCSGGTLPNTAGSDPQESGRNLVSQPGGSQRLKSFVSGNHYSNSYSGATCKDGVAGAGAAFTAAHSEGAAGAARS